MQLIMKSNFVLSKFESSTIYLLQDFWLSGPKVSRTLQAVGHPSVLVSSPMVFHNLKNLACVTHAHIRKEK